MLGWHRETTADRISRRIGALKDELDDLQSALWPRPGGLQRMASEAQDWISERADDLQSHLHKAPLSKVGLSNIHLPQVHLPEVHLPDLRRHVAAPPPSVAVIVAAVAVGAGVGCVLYALASGGKRRPAPFTPKGDRRSASGVEK
ncbi:UNVERIFIED_ORG: hypothetical protein ABID33_002608 [Xanthobacter viscosus]|jgi:hypothetical protein|uniref:DUF3618 domain-containing protein n=1 Tax=Xanthobacter autotrophicus TaxID=280 RepID=A0A6C1KC77_XANAU|nr:hypothetical protein [Xanthobacter autotrophicus]TLX41780.1 hypothetical protein FBQ73_16830 [Xanthobacter autotrophicus]